MYCHLRWCADTCIQCTGVVVAVLACCCRLCCFIPFGAMPNEHHFMKGRGVIAVCSTNASGFCSKPSTKTVLFSSPSWPPGETVKQSDFTNAPLAHRLTLSFNWNLTLRYLFGINKKCLSRRLRQWLPIAIIPVIV